MYQLIKIIENNEFENLKKSKFLNKINEILLNLNKYNYKPVFSYKIDISSKEKTKNNLNRLLEFKQNFEKIILDNNNYNFSNTDFRSAIEINICEINNFTSNIINDLNSKFDLIIGVGGLNRINRFFIEQTKIDILKDPQNDEKKQKIDFLHHLNSGMNHILFKLAKEKEISILVTLNFLEKYNNYKISKEFGRINQNLKFSRKYGVKTKICFEVENIYQIKSKIEEKSIYSLFNISTIQKKESVNLFEEIINNKEKLKKEEYIDKGIIVKNKN